MSIILFVTNVILLACIVILFLIIRDHEHDIVKLESLLNEVNDSISVNTTIIRNHSDILNELKEDIKILNNEVF